MAVHFLKIGKTEQEYIKVSVLGVLHFKPVISKQICLFDSHFESKVRTSCQEYGQSGLQVTLCRMVFLSQTIH